MQLTSRLRSALDEYIDIIKEVAGYHGIDWTVIAAVCWRESHFGLILKPPGPGGTGVHGHGRGLMQIDDRWHKDFVASEKWSDAESNIKYAVDQVLAPAIRYFGGELKPALAAYNAGTTRVRNVIRGGEDPDSVTTGRNYGKDVLNRAEIIKSTYENEDA